jgi:hypothetical protein
MEPDGSLPCTQKSTTATYSDRNQPSPEPNLQVLKIHVNIVKCKGDYRRCFRLDDWIYFTLYIHNSGLQVIQWYHSSTHFSVHRYTRTRVLSLHLSYPGNGFITISLSLPITHEVYLPPSNFFLAISSQSA